MGGGGNEERSLYALPELLEESRDIILLNKENVFYVWLQCCSDWFLIWDISLKLDCITTQILPLSCWLSRWSQKSLLCIPLTSSDCLENMQIDFLDSLCLLRVLQAVLRFFSLSLKQNKSRLFHPPFPHCKWLYCTSRINNLWGLIGWLLDWWQTPLLPPLVYFLLSACPSFFFDNDIFVFFVVGFFHWLFYCHCLTLHTLFISSFFYYCKPHNEIGGKES